MTQVQGEPFNPIQHQRQLGGSGGHLRLFRLWGMDRCRGLKVCLAHGGGYRCFGIGRMDRGWQLRCEVRMPIEKPPRAFLRKFYEDYLTHSAPALRFLIVSVGADRVVLGSDWRAATRIDWPVAWC